MSLQSVSQAVLTARLAMSAMVRSGVRSAAGGVLARGLATHTRGMASTGSQFGAKEDPFHDIPLPTPQQLRNAAKVLPESPSPGELSPALLKAMLQESELGRDSAFMVVDLDSVTRKVEDWKRGLPRVKPYYATDANPDRLVVSTLAGLGVGLECISKGELEIAQWANVPAENLLFAATSFTRSHLKRAAQVGVKLFTCDNADDMLHVARVAPGAEVILRVHDRESDPEHALVPMGRKGGASVMDVPFLATAASNLKLKIAGVGFHAGFANNSPATFEAGVRVARHAWDMLRKAGHHPHIVNVGGGFPAAEGLTRTPFDAIASTLSRALDAAFPEPNVQFVGEPGRFFVAESHTLALTVVGKRRVDTPLPALPVARCVAQQGAIAGPGFMYYLSDGVFGGFNALMLDPSTVELSEEARAVCTRVRKASCFATSAEGALTLDTAIQLESTPRPRVLTQSTSNGGKEQLCMDARGVPFLSSASNLDVLHADLVRVAGPPEGINRGTTLALQYHQGLPPSYGATVVVAAPEETPAVPAIVGLLRTGADPEARPHSSDAVVAKAKGNLHLSTLWGPTTQNVTATMMETWLPELSCGDTLYFRNVGAYTSPRWSHINGIHAPARVYIRNGALVTRSTHPEFAEYE